MLKKFLNIFFPKSWQLIKKKMLKKILNIFFPKSWHHSDQKTQIKYFGLRQN
jgi:hypothetical protein